MVMQRVSGDHDSEVTALQKRQADGAAVRRWVIACVLGLSTFAVRADEAAQRESVAAPELRCELLQRMRIDQNVRIAMVTWTRERGFPGAADAKRLSSAETQHYGILANAVRQADADNAAWLRSIVEERGWPTRSLVGNDGAHAAWLLLQHADRDRAFQRKCLDLMAALPNGEVARADLAYLTDRVLLAEGKKQVYGTQFSSVDGKLRPRPIEDEANVDKRRAEVGLPPLAEYARQIEALYGDRDNK